MAGSLLPHLTSGKLHFSGGQEPKDPDMLLNERTCILSNSNTCWFGKLLWLGALFGIFLLPQAADAQCGPNLMCYYSSVANPTPVALGNGGRTTFPSVAVNQTSTVTLTLNNTGTADGQITSAMLQGMAFQMVEATPVIVPAGGAAIIHLAFTPPSTNSNNPFVQDLSLQYQTVTAQVTVLFVLQGSGLSSQVALSYAFPGGNQTTIDSGGQIFFPATLVGPPLASSTATFTIANTGNSAATLASLSITG
ncbi:MAG: hypothetical protein JO336_16060, partial [Acidobacteriia bacterium]|nr:hypothetical protein [Terriglobia bacterium]